MGIRDKLRSPKKPRQREKVPAAIAEALGLEANETLYISEATARDVGDWQASRVVTTFGRDGKGTTRTALENVKARLLVRCLVDEQGAYVCREEDVTALGEWGHTLLDPLYAMALRLNGLDQDADEKLDPLPSRPIASPLSSENGTSTA